MINKPRFRKGKKAAKTMRDGVPMSPNRWKQFRRYGAAIANWQIKLIEGRRQALRMMLAAVSAANTAAIIARIQSTPTLPDDKKAKMTKAMQIAQASVDGALAIAKAMSAFVIIIALVFGTSSCSKHAHHSKHSISQPKSQ